MKLYRYFILCMLIFCYNALPAQNEHYNFSRLNINDGLSHNQINAIIRDKKGFVWFGTMSGLNRYDGYSFKVFKNNIKDSTSLIDNYISSITELPERKLWITTRSGIVIFDPVTERFERNYVKYLQSLSLPAGTLLDVFRDKKGHFWFSYEQLGLFKYTKDQKPVRLFHLQHDDRSISSSSITCLAEDAAGFLWVVHSNGILEKLDGTTYKVVTRTSALQQINKGEHSYNLLVDANDGLWLWIWSENTGAFYYTPGTSKLIHFHSTDARYHLNNNLVNSIVQDNKGVIWIGTDHGGINLIKKEDNFSIHYLQNNKDDDNSLSQNSINTLYKDDAGIIWIGTYKQGINYFNANNIKFPLFRHWVSAKNSLPYDDVNHFVEDINGNLWIGTNGGGLVFFDRQKNKFTQYLNDPSNPRSLSNNVIVSLCIDHQQKLWIGTYFGGLDCFDGKQFIHYKHNDALPGSISDDRVWEIFEDLEKNLWVGTLAGGLNLFDRRTQTFHHYRLGTGNALQSEYISDLLEDRYGNLWIGTANGIDVLNKKTKRFTHFGHDGGPHSIANNNVLCLLEDKKGNIWVGTREGLSVIEQGTKKAHTFTTGDGLPDNTILTILEDNRNNLWITTPNGLSNLVFEGSPGKHVLSFQVRNYDEVNNLQGREFNENAALKLKDGRLIVGGAGGFNLIDPLRINSQVSKQAIVFTNLQVFNKNVGVNEKLNNRVILKQAISETEEITLQYKLNVFSIEFAALDYVQSSKQKYAYKLEGFNKNWLYTDGNNRKATYTNLDAGTYYFKVKATNANNVWSSEEKTLKIIVLPSFWRTPWAFALYGLVIIGILLLIRKYEIEQAKMRFQVAEQRRETDRINALDALKTKLFTNVSHEFRTPLSLILSPLERIIKNAKEPDQKKQLQLIQRNAKRLLNLVNQLLDFRKLEVQAFKLTTAHGDIVQFTKDITYSFSDISEKKSINLSFQSNIELLKTYFDTDKLEKILFNLLSNAFKYTPDLGNVSVHVNFNPAKEVIAQTLQIIVKDTGIGLSADKYEKIFERYFQNDVPGNILNQGSGIGLAITREFVKLHGGYIKVESEPGKGTSFIVTLPVRLEAEVYTKTVVTQEIIAQARLEPRDTKDDLKQADKSKTTILLVEDNDDFRFYLKDNLNIQYRVIEAANGKEGWDLVKKEQPDLVVSDIMMPQMNGIELSRRIKNDPRTSHIPVVLLTAMADEEAQLDGYQVGINDYITKPFTFEILASRIKNLLGLQKQWKKNLEQGVKVNPSASTITPLDEQFMKKALEIVEKNMSNTNFSVEELSRDLHISRVALYKKLLSLTHTTPLEFIRTIRLKRGAQLLAKSQMTIAEVAYEVGFNNPKIFSKYFKEEFNMLPSHYMAEQPDNRFSDEIVKSDKK